MSKIKVLIVDDSIFFREFMSRCLCKDPAIEIVGVASDAAEAMQKIESLSPDVVVLDMEMPNMRGPDFLKRARPKYPHVQVIAISAYAGNVHEAMQAGAVDFVAKPNVQAKVGHVSFVNESIQKIKAAVSAPKKQAAKPASKPKQAPAKPAFPAASPVSTLARAAQPAPAAPGPQTVIAIGASTGGTEAILSILKELPASTPGVLVVQHMPPVFTKMYAERLDKLCAMTVTEAQNGDRLRQGTVLIAPGNLHMRLRRDQSGYYVHCATGDKVSGHCPSVDVLFESVAQYAGSSSIGVILTGMGADGAKNLLEMRRKGAYTIGQNQATCVVYGMPMVAFNLGAVDDQLALDAIPGAIMRHLTK